MKFKTVFTEAAKSDIHKAAFWYEAQSSGLGKQFIKSIRLEIKSIRNTPYGFAVRFGDFRAIPLKKFPYLLYYLIEENPRIIVVFAVFHAHSNPINMNDKVKAE